MHENVIKLKQYDLEWWIDYIEPVVANIVKTFKEEEVDRLFWQSIYKHYVNGRGSGTYIHSVFETVYVSVYEKLDSSMS